MTARCWRCIGKRAFYELFPSLWMSRLDDFCEDHAVERWADLRDGIRAALDIERFKSGIADREAE